MVIVATTCHHVLLLLGRHLSVCMHTYKWVWVCRVSFGGGGGNAPLWICWEFYFTCKWIIKTLMRQWMVKYVRTVPDSTKLHLIKGPEEKIFRGACPPPLVCHMLCTWIHTCPPPPPNNPYNLILPPPALGQKAERNPGVYATSDKPGAIVTPKHATFCATFRLMFLFCWAIFTLVYAVHIVRIKKCQTPQSLRT